MLNRAVRGSVLDLRWQATALPPTFLLPWRARLFNSTSTNTTTSEDAVPDALRAADTTTYETPLSTPSPSQPPAVSPSPQSVPPTPPDTTLLTLLPLLRAQKSHYITAHIHSRPYLLTPGDTLRLPFLMHGVKPGDILRLNRASNIGSRDYTLKGAPYVDERLFECRARVVGVESEPMRIKEKTKRRQRKVKTVKSKMRFTVLRVVELRVKGLEEVEG
ncbi:MAG: hypothetical protein M1830_004191 [Pleopsidium flavum]|nr:MAG: hypothetical protein M1830_004191 [Pleopsidium flavum]